MGKNVGPFQAWMLIIYMMLVRLDTVPLAIQHLKWTLMDWQRDVGILSGLLEKECISEWRSHSRAVWSS